MASVDPTEARKLAGFGPDVRGHGRADPGSHFLPERVFIGTVSADFFKVLSLPPVLGRAFITGEDMPGKNGVCVISFGFWKRRFGGDPKIIGQSLNLNSAAIEVIGSAGET